MEEKLKAMKTKPKIDLSVFTNGMSTLKPSETAAKLFGLGNINKADTLKAENT